MDNESDEEFMSEALKSLCFNVFKCGTGDIDNVRIMLEMNFNGKNVINLFKSAYNFYDDVVVKTHHTQPIPGQKLKKKFGYKTTGGKHGKGYWCEIAAKMISKRQIVTYQFDENPNRSTFSQLQNFGKKENGSYEGSCMHDDIAVTVLFLPRFLMEPENIEWVEEWISLHSNEKSIEKVLHLLKIYADDEFSLNDSEFTKLYSNGNNQNQLNYPRQMQQGSYISNISKPSEISYTSIMKQNQNLAIPPGFRKQF